MTEIDHAFEMARAGDHEAFADWMEHVHLPIRRSLGRFAWAVDVEAVLQETFLRMWIAATDPKRSFDGENASFRFALRLARNVALEEVRRARLGHLVPLDGPDGPPEIPFDPEPPPDPALRRAIAACLEALRGPARKALALRLRLGHLESDRDLAERAGMKLNTFLQNVVRARKSLARCLGDRGVRLEGIPS